jgi:TRAP-type mannitol/chloroaromatic compound transport system permease small subunit
MLIKLEKIFDKFADILGYISAIILILMTVNVFYDVIMRYFFKTGSIAFQELEWHLFGLLFLVGISYTLKEDGHVRVDVIYDNLSAKKKAVINIVGTIVFLIPFALLIAFGSIEFVKESYQMHEISGDPGGLKYRWLIKSAIPISFFLFSITSIGFIIKNINLFRDKTATSETRLGGYK